MLEGLRFLRGRKDVLMTFLVDINAMVFGMPRALFPAVAGLFYAGGAGGGGSARVRSGGRGGARPRCSPAGSDGCAGRAWRCCSRSRCGALAIVVFGLVPLLWFGLVMLALAGAADMVSAVFRSDDPADRHPGRSARTSAGSLHRRRRRRAAARATSSRARWPSLFGERVSIVSGGLLCILGVVVLAMLFPSFARYRSDVAGAEAVASVSDATAVELAVESDLSDGTEPPPST